MNKEARGRLRPAWVLPSMARGYYWQPVLSEFARIYPRSIVYTGIWPGFLAGFEGSFQVRATGKTRFLTLQRGDLGYEMGISFPSMTLLLRLLLFRPQVILVAGFSLWSVFALSLKALIGSKVVIIYSGTGAHVDMTHSRLRLGMRRAMTRYADALITNSRSGKNYLTTVLHADAARVFARPYRVPQVASMSAGAGQGEQVLGPIRRPVFLVISRLIKIKGLHLLLEACRLLRKWGCNDYSVVVLGDGPQREELERLTAEFGLRGNVQWLGWVEYPRLSEYFTSAEVLVFPTLMDTWGMVVLEAMAFGKAILCSKWAGAADMVVEGENGYVFDPRAPESLARLMRKFAADPELARVMGARSKMLIEPYTPRAAAHFLDEIVGICLRRSSAGGKQDSHR